MEHGSSARVLEGKKNGRCGPRPVSLTSGAVCCAETNIQAWSDIWVGIPVCLLLALKQVALLLWASVFSARAVTWTRNKPSLCWRFGGCYSPALHYLIQEGHTSWSSHVFQNTPFLGLLFHTNPLFPVPLPILEALFEPPQNRKGKGFNFSSMFYF